MIDFNILSYFLGIGTLILLVVILDYLIAPIIGKIQKKKLLKEKELKKKEKRIEDIETKLSYLDTQITALEFTFKDFKKKVSK